MEYHVRPMSKTCSVTGEPLEPGTRCYSVLLDRNGSLERLDIAERAWQGPPDGTVGVWRRIVPEQKTPSAAQVDPRVMQAYFEQLVEEAQPAREKLLYVLALYLLKKRKLQLDGSRVDGEVEYLQLSGTDGSGPYEVRDQHLSAEEISVLQQELAVALAAEWSE